VASLGYALCEDIRPGRFDMETATALGVPFGPLCGELQQGRPVALESGAVVKPEQVVGPARPGRRLVFSGDTRPCPGTREASAGADLLVHEATFLEEESDRARETGHSTAIEAAQLALDAQVTMLALTHLSTRYTGGQIRREARTVFDQTVVPRDFDVIAVPLAERGAPRLIRSDQDQTPVEAPAPAG
jgi:ribonuclease Z